MLFLVEYDRMRGELVTFRTFDSADQKAAEDRRVKLEIDLNRRNVNHEVVLLEAADEGALRKTHRRYFENLTELVSGD